jgi:thiol-disulfide isomerase/thioredoxin
LIARTLVAVATLAVALAATPASAPSPFSELVVGKSAAAMTFAPIGGALRAMIEPGKPTVVIAFASWCSACMAEMPRNVRDYARFKDRVNFVGIDYVDSASGGDAVIAKFAVPFPVERLGTDAGAVSGAATGVTGPVASPGDAIIIHGVTPETLAAVLPAIKSQVPAIYPALVAIAAHCAPLSESECLAYAHAKGVVLDSAAHLTSPPAGSKATVSLPTMFVIDARGIVVQHLEGYDSNDDPIPAALAKLGIL